ncbi:MAG TPA: HypC/HybG/HupF family hydrogenase formation chaperone [Actinomycetota bacterium]|nr:HypC/HybG/HupF family hydrogenase formation chaperone [Actinomycetota bacterium]
MCLGIPGRIVEIVDVEKSIAKVDVAGVKRNISTAVLDQGGEQVAIGEWVLIHVGFALSKIDEQEAEETYRFLHGLGQAYSDELKVLEESEIE